MAAADTPLHVFRFEVTFRRQSLQPGQTDHSDVALCSGAFAECTGLEATMEPKAIKAGGVNYGVAQRVGPVTFATVVLKRGMTSSSDLWTWFDLVAGGKYAYRLEAEIAVRNAAGDTVLTWLMSRALPVKFKAADLNAKGSEIGIEELHLAHEGLQLLPGDGGGAGAGASGGFGLSAGVSLDLSVGVSASASAGISGGF